MELEEETIGIVSSLVTLVTSHAKAGCSSSFFAGCMDP